LDRARIADSEPFHQRTREDAEFRVFDGVHLPFADHSVDLVVCKQVLEHVERPHELVPDVGRVLRSGGIFAGSTSHLEPCHGYSIANFTPYGLKRLLERSGFEVELLLPGIDGPTLIVRRLLRGPKCFDRWWSRRSPLNSMLDGVLRVLRWDAEDRNAIKLLFCGHVRCPTTLIKGPPTGQRQGPSSASVVSLVLRYRPTPTLRQLCRHVRARIEGARHSRSR